MCPNALRLARFVPPAALLLLVLPAVGCTTHAQRRVQAEQHWKQVRADMKYQLAKQQFERGQIEAAVDTVNEALAIDGTSAAPFLLLAYCHLEQGKLASARQAVAQARHCAPASGEVEYTLGIIAERTDQMERALEHYRRARVQDEDVVDYLVAEAECLGVLGYPEEALALVFENTDGFDSDGTLEMLCAQLHLLIGDRETAIHDLRLAMERSGCGAALGEGPGGCDLLIEQYGRLLSQTGRYVEAVGLLRPYVEAREEVSASVVTALCTGYLATNRPEPARRLLRDELRRHPGNAQGWMLLVQAAAATGDWMTARRGTDQLERLAPHGAQAHLLRGFVCWKQDDLLQAQEALQRALHIDPGDALAHRLIARVLEDLDRRGVPHPLRSKGWDRAAEEHYRRALQIDPSLTRGES